MPKVGLTSVIDKSFLNSFLGLARGETSGSSLASALNGGESTKASFSDGLRLGARAFGTAVQNLNSLTNYVGLSQGTLTTLGELTDEMIALTEKATKSTTGLASRKKLIVQFEDLAREFKNITKDAKIGERELLNAGDLSDLFVNLGLDKESSDTVAELFGKFIFEEDEDQSLASEDATGKGFLKIPANAFAGPNKKIEVSAFTEEQLTTSAPEKAALTSEGSVAQSGSTVSFTDSQGTTDVQNIDALFGTDSFSGYSVAASSSDYLGFNGGGNQQLFVFDASGQALQQLTNNQNAGLQYTSADISTDGLSVAYTSLSGGQSSVGTRTVNSLGVDPATASEQVYDSSTNTYSDIKISSDGSHVSYKDTDSLGDERVALRDTVSGNRNNTLYQQVNTIGDFQFIDTDRIVYDRVSGDKFDVVSYAANSTSSILASNLDSVRGLVAVEKGLTSNGSFYFGLIDDDAQNVDLYREGRGLVARSSFEGDSVDSISLATTVLGTESVEVALKGVRPSVNGDNDSELYKLNENGSQTLSVPTRLAAASQQVGDVLNSSHKLLRKPDAYRLLHDLKGLKEQIETNYEALEDARNLIQDNIELVRSAGFAFLEISGQIGSEEEADQVARKLRQDIRSAPAAALAQAENLENIAVAALTVDEDDVGLDS